MGDAISEIRHAASARQQRKVLQLDVGILEWPLARRTHHRFELLPGARGTHSLVCNLLFGTKRGGDRDGLGYWGT